MRHATITSDRRSLPTFPAPGPGDGSITVVTAYFDLGSFQKGGDKKNIFTPNLYLGWAKTFNYLMNPLVVYTDSTRFKNWMQNLRSNMTEKTKIFLVERSSLWIFQRIGEIRSIYEQTSYPKHFPNTVIPEYACTQHAKYDLLSRAAKENYFHTNYFAWLDVGYFRDIARKQAYFVLQTPPKFNSSKIAMNQINVVDLNMNISNIFRRNLVWVGGGLFLGRRDVVIKYEELYKRAVDYFLSRNLMNTDQQVTYAMFSKTARQEIKPEIGIQIYKSRKTHDWFYLGYLMRKLVTNKSNV